jgi:hypothetical protein
MINIIIIICFVIMFGMIMLLKEIIEYVEENDDINE